MADQNNLTFGGIGADPSSSYLSYDMGGGWDLYEYSQGVAVYRPTSNGIITDPGASSADATDTYYTNEFSIKGNDWDGATLRYPASGDSQITMQWEWYNPTGEAFTEVALGTAASHSGGTWTAIGTSGASAYAETIAIDDNAEWDVVLKGSKVRLRVLVTDAGSDGVAAGLVTAAIDAINHVTTGAFVKLANTKSAELNDTINNPITFGGIGADPS